MAGEYNLLKAQFQPILNTLTNPRRVGFLKIANPLRHMKIYLKKLIKIFIKESLDFRLDNCAL